MAIVGTAYVRLRVIGDTLKKDLTKSVKDAVDQGKPEVEKAGKTVGDEMSKGISEKISTDAKTEMKHVADDIGNALGDAMGKNMNRGLGVKLMSAMSGIWSNLKDVSNKGIRGVGDVFRGFGSIFKKAKIDADAGGGGLAGFFKTWWSGANQRFDEGKKKITDSFSKFKKDLKKQTKDLGLSDFMVPLIGALVTALPSALSFAGAVIGSFVGWAVTALASLGPAIAGGALAGVAAMGTLKLSMGLLKLAMSGTNAEVKTFKKGWESFKEQAAKPIQEGLFSGLNASMRLAQPLLKAVTPELRQFGFTAGDVAINFTRMLTSAQNTARIKSILATNNVAVKDLGAGVTGLAQAFLILFQHLAPVITYLASGLKDLGAWAAQTLQTAEATGRLDHFISTVFAATKQLVGILVDFAKGLANVFRAAYGASGGMLTNLQGIAARFKEWTGSQAGQAKMLDFFTKARVVTDQVLQILRKITTAAGHGLGGMNVDSIVGGLKTLESLGKPIADMFNAIKKNSGGAWQQTFQNFAKVVTQLANSGVFGVLAKALSNFFQILSAILAIPGVAKLLGLVASLAVLAKTFSMVFKVAKLLWTGLSLLFDVLGAIAGILGWPITLVLALTAALVWFFTQTKIGRKIVEEAWNAIKTAGIAVWHALVDAWHAITTALGKAWDWIKSTAASVGKTFVKAWDAVVSFFKGLPGKLWNGLKAAADKVGQWIGDVIGFFKGLPGKVWDAIKEFGPKVLAAIGNGLLTALKAVADFIASVVVFFITLPIKIAITLGVLGIKLWDAIKAGFDFLWANIPVWWANVIAWFAALPGRIWTALSAIGTTIWNGLKAAWDWVQTNTAAAWNAVITWFSQLPGRFWNALSTIGQTIWNGLKAAWTWVSTNTRAAWNAVVSWFEQLPGRFVNGLRSLGSSIAGVMTSAWSWAKRIVSEGVDSIVGFVKGLPGRLASLGGAMLSAGKNLISSLISGLGNAVGFIGNVGAKVVNAIIGFINSHVIDSIDSALNFTVMGVHINAGVLPHIPYLAKGGVVSPNGGGTLAMIGEAGNYERVEPLDENGMSKRDYAVIRTLSAAIGGDTQVRVFIGDQELNQIVSAQVDRKNKNLAGRLATGRKG